MSTKRIFLATLLAAGALFPAAVRANTLSSDVIGLFPKNVGEFAYADLKEARKYPWFGQLKDQMLPSRFRQFEQFLGAAGVDPDSQVEELAWGLVPSGLSSNKQTDAAAVPTSEQVVGIALGQFSPETAEAYFKAQKLPVIKIRGFSLFPFGTGSGPNDLVFFFIDSNTAAFGQRALLERLIAVRFGEEDSVLRNDQMISLINEANGSGLVWAVLDAAYTRLAIQQLAPETSQFPQAAQLAGRLKAMTISVQGGDQLDANFNAVCNSPDDANTFAALMQAGLLYRRYQVQQTNPDLAQMLDQARITPSGDRLAVELTLTQEQMLALIRSNTFAIKM